MLRQSAASRLQRPRPATVAPAQVTTRSMWVWRAVIVIGWTLLVTSFVLLAWEIVHWLQEGTWRSISLAKMTHMPDLNQSSEQSWSSHDFFRAAVRWFGRMPAVEMLFIGGLVCSWRANNNHTRAEAHAAHSRQVLQ